MVHNMSCNMTKPTKSVCAQRRLRSAWASAHSDQTGQMPVLIESSLVHTHFVGFVMSRLTYTLKASLSIVVAAPLLGADGKELEHC